MSSLHMSEQKKICVRRAVLLRAVLVPSALLILLAQWANVVRTPFPVPLVIPYHVFHIRVSPMSFPSTFAVP
jgi:hypothetical protein